MGEAWLFLLAEDTLGPQTESLCSQATSIPLSLPAAPPCFQAFPRRRTPASCSLIWVPSSHQEQEKAQENRVPYKARAARAPRVWARKTVTCPKPGTELEVQDPGVLPLS